MKKIEKNFLLGAATAAHQVEGNNIDSDFWAMEQLEHTDFVEPSLDAVDHYNRYEQDISLLAEAGLNAYRFSIEWARIEPEKGQYSAAEIAHYKKVLECCHQNGVEPIVTLHHFSSPKWLIEEGGWENEATVAYFKNYCAHVATELGQLMRYVCTINEANMGLQIAAVAQDIMRQMGIELQVGMSFPLSEERQRQKAEAAKAFGIADAEQVNTFLSLRSQNGDLLIMRAHEAARDAMKTACPHLQVGLTLSLYDIQAQPGGEEKAAELWFNDFGHYLPFIQKDDFIGVQNYSRKRVDAKGSLPAPEEAERTEMDYEFYPQGIANVIRKVAKVISLPILVTENGIATTDDSRRVAFIQQALAGVQACIEDGLPVKGYLYWSLLDNFEWMKGFSMHFGLIAVDRKSQTRHPKESLCVLGSYL